MPKISPQLENGYTRIANDLLEAFIEAKLTEYQRKIVLFIWRKTYGFQKKEDYIANSQFVKATGINKGNVSRTLRELEVARIVIRRDNRLAINKEYTKWLIVIRRDNKSYPTGKQKLSPQQPQKKKEKRNIPTGVGKKENMNKYSDTNHSDFYEKSIDIDTGENIISESQSKLVTKIRMWGEERRGQKFINKAKEHTHIKKMLTNGISPKEIFTRWKKLEQTDFAKKNGMSFTSVLNSLDKKRG